MLTAPIEIRARHRSRCTWCGCVISVGAVVLWWPRWGAAHVECVPEGMAHLG